MLQLLSVFRLNISLVCLCFYFESSLKMTNCNFLSLNVRGLKRKQKRLSIFSYLKDQNCAFYLLQETYSERHNELLWKSEWGGKIFFSHGSNHQKGVCILLNPLYDIQIESSFEDSEGRIVLINACFETVKFSVCNVYAPNNPALQKVFIGTLELFLMSKAVISYLILPDYLVHKHCIQKPSLSQNKR